MAKDLVRIHLKKRGNAQQATVFGTHDRVLGTHDVLIDGTHDSSWPVPGQKPIHKIGIRRDGDGNLFITLEE
jgi:hypothetical protein